LFGTTRQELTVLPLQVVGFTEIRKLLQRRRVLVTELLEGGTGRRRLELLRLLDFFGLDWLFGLLRLLRLFSRLWCIRISRWSSLLPFRRLWSRRRASFSTWELNCRSTAGDWLTWISFREERDVRVCSR
jgi:hypothetical protein